MEKNSRNLGLDIVRSIAIILVLISHSRLFFKSSDLQFLSICGLLGVEIFFVLSGFLIGKIIINNIVDEPSLKSLKIFYIRRWFRTLPLYYLVLFLVSAINNRSIPYRNYVFLQNFNEKELGFLAVSWSLSVEEWFYFLVPIILIVFLKLLDGKMERKKVFFIVSISIGLISLLLRCYTVLKSNPTWDYGIRKQIFLRLDAIMFGVILAGFKNYYKNIYNKINLTKLPAVFTLMGFLLISCFYIGWLGSGTTVNNFITWKILLFSIIPLVCMFFVSWLETNSLVNKKLVKFKISKLFNFISIASYSIYLVHYTIYSLLANREQGFKKLLLAIVLTLIMAILLNRLYEIPIMNLRDKINFRGNEKIDIK